MPDFQVLTTLPLTIAPGAFVDVQVQYAPETVGSSSGALAVVSNAPGQARTVTLAGQATSGVTLPTLSVSDAVLSGGVDISVSDAVMTEAVPEAPAVELSSTSVAFPPQAIGDTGALRNIVLTNTGGGPLTIASITATGDFTQTNDLDGPLAPGDTVTIVSSFAPTATGARTGAITVVSDAPTSPDVVTLGGTALAAGTVPSALSRLTTAGNQIQDDFGTSVRLKAVNWFGGEAENFTPNGIWSFSYKVLLDQIKSFGFNCIRLPWSGDLVTPGRMPQSINMFANPDLEGKTALEVFDAILNYCEEIELYVVLDHHRRTSGGGSGADGSPISGTYPKAQWIADWVLMATRYRDNLAVVGADVHNEPHDLAWSEWRSLCEECGNAIHAVNPDWLIFVEGTMGNVNGHGTWWGGNLSFVATDPVVLTKPHKLVYSPHEYGQSIGTRQPWLTYDDQPVAAFPANLYAIWREVFGFIHEQNIAPLFVGEFGGFFGFSGGGVADQKPHGVFERQWLSNLIKYMNGDYDGNGVSSLAPGQVGLHYAYWSLNPNSGDTGGLLQDDFATPQAGKLALLAPLLT